MKMERNRVFMAFLEQTGHYIRREEDLPKMDSHAYKKVDFKPGFVAMLMAHSMISGRPRSNFYTNGEHVYYQEGSETKNSELTDIQKEDILREDEVLKVLGATPKNLYDLYAEVDGHLRLDNFADLYREDEKPKIDFYREYLEKISKDVSAETIRKDAKIQIGNRIKKHYNTLQGLITALKEDEPELKQIGEKLENSLIKYSSE